MCSRVVFYLFVFSIGVASFSFCACDSLADVSDQDEELPDLTTIGIEGLMSLDLEVTTATRRQQSVSQTASALHVITREEIERSGARHVVELLRLAPGVQVAQINGNTWAVSIRGDNQRFSNQILVLVDGRTVYTPLFSGTLWETLDVEVENIAQIEIVRGPGASVWGSNAVNGVINIITLDGGETPGTKAVIGGGTHERYFHFLRHTENLSDLSTFRISQGFSKRSDNRLKEGGSAEDDWDIATGELRLDHEGHSGSKFAAVLSGYYQEEYLATTVPSLSPPFINTEDYSSDAYNAGSTLGLRYSQEIAKDHELSTQLDYIYENRDGAILPLRRNSLDLQAVLNSKLSDDTILTSGMGYQFYSDRTDGSFAEALIPDDLETHLFSGFVQAQQSILDDKITMLGGVKLEQNSYSGLEAMPTARVVWNPTHFWSVWGGYSRAATSPGRISDDTLLPIQVIPNQNGDQADAIVVVRGSNSVEAAILNAYELGARRQISSDVFLDIALFYYDFQRLLGAESSAFYFDEGGLFGQPIGVVPVTIGNSYQGWSRGGELSVDWNTTDWMAVSASYSYFDNTTVGGANTLESEIQLREGNNPRHQMGLRLAVDIDEHVKLDSFLRYVDHLSFGEVDSYWELDMRVSWEILSNLEIAVMGRNLLDDHHQENQGTIFSPPPTEIERSFWSSLSYSF